MNLLKLQKGALSVVIAVITEHYIMGFHSRRIDLGHLANNFCRSCRDEEEETVPYLPATCTDLYQRRKYLGAYYMDGLEKLSRFDIGSLNRLIGSSVWFFFYPTT